MRASECRFGSSVWLTAAVVAISCSHTESAVRFVRVPKRAACTNVMLPSKFRKTHGAMSVDLVQPKEQEAIPCNSVECMLTQPVAHPSLKANAGLNHAALGE